MHRQTIIAVVLVLAVSPGNAQQAGTAADGGLFSLDEFSNYTSQFNNVQITPGDFATPDSNFSVGGTLFFQQNRPTGLLLLQSSAAAGNSEAAVALGIVADRNGDSAAAFQWFAQAAEAGDQTGLLLQGRSQLYGVGTPQDFQDGTRSLLDAYTAGDRQAAWDLAKTASYSWADVELPSPQALWRDALQAGDPVVSADYARFLRAGGEAAGDYQSIDQIVAPIFERDTTLGAIAAWDFGRASFKPPSERTLDALKAASDLGNVDAAARYGDWLVSRDAAADQQLGLGYLAQAARKGQSTAFTSIGKFYLGQPEGTALALDNLMAGLKLGDTDAGVPLADYYIAKNEFGRAYDYSLLAATSGTARGSSEAVTKVRDICKRDAAKCTEVIVAFVTSRQHDEVDRLITFNGLPTDGFAPTYGFAKVLVAGEDAPEDTDFDWFGAIGNAIFSFLGLSTNAPDPFAESAVVATLAHDWTEFADGVGKAVVEDQDRGGDGGFLLFVHGVNTSFEGAILAVARLKLKGNLPGIPVVYSWPAGDLIRTNNGVPSSFGYTADVNIASRNCASFQDFLVRFTKSFGSNNVTLIAHSRGSDMMISGLTACRAAPAGTERVSPLVKHVIYAAPDVDTTEFIDIAPQIEGIAADVTLYASDADLALFVSGDLLNDHPRAGMGGNRRTVVPGVDTIDLSNIAANSGSADGHGYLWTANAVLDDLNEIIRHNSKPGARCLDERPTSDGGKYWEFRPACGLQ